MTEQSLVLLNPGPACTTERVRAALGRGDACHREPEFGELLERIKAGLTRSLEVGDTHQAVLVTGSGTAAMEMAVISSVREGASIAIINNGVYGDRLAKMARAHQITVHEVPGSWTEPADTAELRRVLAAHPDIDAVACVMHETTTGLLNPVAEIGEIVAGTGAVFVVDAISATGNEGPSLADIKADFICGTANKGLHGLPGMSFILVSQAKGMPRITAAPVRSLYLSAATYLKDDVPFTSAVQVCYAFDEAIKEFAELGGYPARAAEYRARAALLREGFTRLGLEILVPEPYRSQSVTMLRLPQGVKYQPLHDELKRRGYVIYAGQGSLSEEYFRICNFGHLPADTLRRFLVDLEEALKACS